MKSRFEKALDDLESWRCNRQALLNGLTVTPQLESVIRAVDSALKAEVLEFRIRNAINLQVLSEVVNAGTSPSETETGRHLWDFDWWLTEATMRSLHAGLDGIAQLINYALKLGVKPEVRDILRQVEKAMGARADLGEATLAVKGLRMSQECIYLRAFVNHVKHAGFPQRGMIREHKKDCLTRETTVQQFMYKSHSYGPWTPSDVESIIDGYRQHVIAVVDAASRVTG
jgi:hypothetical protein